MRDIRITKEMIEHIACLARLRLDGPEKAKYADELGRIIRYANMLNELDTSGVEPMKHVVPFRNVFREDRDEVSLDREILLGNSPVNENGFFKVPGVIDMPGPPKNPGLPEDAGRAEEGKNFDEVVVGREVAAGGSKTAGEDIAAGGTGRSAEVLRQAEAKRPDVLQKQDLPGHSGED